MESNERERLRQEIGLFRYGLIADVLQLDGGHGGGLYRRLREKSEVDYRIPGSQRTRVAVETMRGWIALYRKGGFDALLPDVRRDRGSTRAVPEAVCDVLIATKEAHPNLSVQLLITQARASGLIPADLVLAPSTVHRLLARAGVMERPGSGRGAAALSQAIAIVVGLPSSAPASCGCPTSCTGRR